jgi:hypothetical protein
MKSQLTLLLATLAAIPALTIPASGAEGVSLQGAHEIRLSGGGLTQSRFGDDQFIGTLSYHYWADESFAFGVLFGGIATDDDYNYCDTRNEGVGLAHASIQYRPAFLNFHPRMYITLQASTGAYVGAREYRSHWRDCDGRKHRRSEWKDEDETQWGAYLGANLNVAITRHFHLGVSSGYHFVRTFDTPINGERKFSSPDVRLSLSFLFGNRS